MGSRNTLRRRLGQSRRYLKLAFASLWRGTPDAPRRHAEASLQGKVDEYNAAAEGQWRAMNEDADRRGYLLEKPFAGLRDTPPVLYRLGLALEALDLGLGHTVLDFGAGSCWVSLILNRLRCRTISMDVSPTALAMGREAFAREPQARPELRPRFETYDGRRLPLVDESVDRILCFDSFHHVPNQEEILAEFHRVLRRGGRVVMAEPGEGHAAAEASEFDAGHFEVLENDLVLEELVERARRAGFDVKVKPYPDVPILVLSAEAHLRLLAGDHSLFPMQHMIDSLRQFHVLMFFKGAPSCDSRNPGVLRAAISLPSGSRIAGRAGTLVRLRARIENTGDTLWLSAEDREIGGYVNWGAHLLDASGRTLRIGHLTERLPRDVAPGEVVEIDHELVLPEVAGRFRLQLDLVDANVAWFSQRGSPTAEIEMAVEWSDSRDPHRLEARIEPLGPFPPRAESGGFPLRLRLTNAGDTIWIADPPDARGSVRVGVQVLSANDDVVTRDHYRIALPRDVTPGETVEVEAVVPRPPAASRFAVDLVAEKITWFVSHGSKPVVFSLE